jgi:nitric oxide dioxygenase
VQYEVFGPDLWQADLLTEPSPGARQEAPAAG